MIGRRGFLGRLAAGAAALASGQYLRTLEVNEAKGEMTVEVMPEGTEWYRVSRPTYSEIERTRRPAWASEDDYIPRSSGPVYAEIGGRMVKLRSVRKLPPTELPLDLTAAGYTKGRVCLLTPREYVELKAQGYLVTRCERPEDTAIARAAQLRREELAR